MLKITVAREPGIADQDVEIAERVDGRLDHRLRVGEVRDVAEVRHGLAAHLLDLLDHGARGRLVAALAVDADPEIAHDDASALPGELERVRLAEAVRGARDHCDLAVQRTHIRRASR
jgi:hypothetical protein